MVQNCTHTYMQRLRHAAGAPCSALKLDPEPSSQLLQYDAGLHKDNNIKSTLTLVGNTHDTVKLKSTEQCMY